jgi:hypothetical protein
VVQGRQVLGCSIKFVHAIHGDEHIVKNFKQDIQDNKLELSRHEHYVEVSMKEAEKYYILFVISKIIIDCLNGVMSQNCDMKIQVCIRAFI